MQETNMRILGGRRIVLAVVAALLMPATSATASYGTDHRSLEERVVSDLFVSGVDGATLIGIPSCGTGTTLGSKRYPEKYPVTHYRTCAGEVKTWDGIELDTRVSFPCQPASSACLASGVGSDPLPMVVLLHSWGGNRNAVQGTYSQAGHPGNDPDAGLSPARFLAKGYATLVYTARGYQASCGPVDVAGDLNGAGGTDVLSGEEKACLQGHTHLAERAFEIADTQHLLGRLVDLKVADRNRLAATGGSYGGGQSWLLATAMPWDTPAGTSKIQLAAAAPFAGWTDFYGSLAPNGRATDGVDQSASHEKPFGVVKERTFNATYGVRSPQPFIPDPFPAPGSLPSYVLSTLASGIRYNTTNPLELHSFIDGWAAVFNAGEPHASQQAVDLPPAFRGKSAYYPVGDPKNDYLTQLAARRVRPVPIFAVQGWTDHFFPAVEALQMYRKLKAAHPGYPIKMLIGDIGHGAQAPEDQVRYSTDQAGDFIDTQLGVATDRVVPAAA
jgi:predicted acyl esterase